MRSGLNVVWVDLFFYLLLALVGYLAGIAASKIRQPGFRPWQLIPRFGLRTLIVAITAGCVVLGSLERIAYEEQFRPQKVVTRTAYFRPWAAVVLRCRGVGYEHYRDVGYSNAAKYVYFFVSQPARNPSNASTGDSLRP